MERGGFEKTSNQIWTGKDEFEKDNKAYIR
jgi:hypothetical protein